MHTASLLFSDSDLSIKGFQLEPPRFRYLSCRFHSRYPVIIVFILPIWSKSKFYSNSNYDRSLSNLKKCHFCCLLFALQGSNFKRWFCYGYFLDHQSFDNLNPLLQNIKLLISKLTFRWSLSCLLGIKFGSRLLGLFTFSIDFVVDP